MASDHVPAFGFEPAVGTTDPGENTNAASAKASDPMDASAFAAKVMQL